VVDAGREPNAGTVRKATPSGRLLTLAKGFNKPNGLAVAPDGTVYVADTDNNCIKKISPAGEVSSLVGASLNRPAGVAVAPDGTVYVADTYNNGVQKVSVTGPAMLLASGFTYPAGVAVDAAGIVYVTDTGHSSLKKIARSGEVSTLTGGALGTSASIHVGKE
jgi:sugar lactone lactonase YvrE